MSVWPFIEAEEAEQHSVKRACALLEVSRAAYYDRRRRPLCQRAITDITLTEEIRRIHAESDGTYGAPRLYRALRDGGHAVSRKRVARLMVRAGLAGRARRRWRVTTIADPHAQLRPDLIGGDFEVGEDLDRRWCGDITYIPVAGGWAYLATVIDIASRRVVGWALANHMRTPLVTDALTDACRRRHPDPGVIFHSDRGSQYTSHDYAAVARSLGVTLSVSRTGRCWDNALAESFFATLKTELIYTRPWNSIDELRAAVFAYIEGWYNTRRLHSTLGYQSPARYETAIHTAAHAA